MGFHSCSSNGVAACEPLRMSALSRLLASSIVAVKLSRRRISTWSVGQKPFLAYSQTADMNGRVWFVDNGLGDKRHVTLTRKPSNIKLFCW